MIRQVDIPVPPEAIEIIRGLDAVPAAALEAARATMDDQNELTVGHIQTRKLSQRGPQTLGVRTNRLRLSVRPSKAEISGTAVTGTIGSNVEYLGPHEFGFDGDVQVRAFTRRRYGRKAQGRAAVDSVELRFSFKDGKIIRKEKKKVRYVEGEVQVAAHTRHMKFPERAPLRRGIEERAPATGKALGAAILRVFP